MLALLPKLSEGSVNLMKAESPGPISTKLRPRTGETARILYRIYIALTVAEALLLRIAGLPLFDAITTALTTRPSPLWLLPWPSSGLPTRPTPPATLTALS